MNVMRITVPVIAAMVATSAFAQSNSTGGSLGKTNKSVSGSVKKPVKNKSKSRKIKKVAVKSTSMQCKAVASKSGWQTFSFTNQVTKVASVSGSWVWHPGHKASGPSGTPGTSNDLFAPAKQFNAGSLLAKFKSSGIINLTNTRNLNGGINKVQLRINDSDIGLFDNSGQMTVCFR